MSSQEPLPSTIETQITTTTNDSDDMLSSSQNDGVINRLRRTLSTKSGSYFSTVRSTGRTSATGSSAPNTPSILESTSPPSFSRPTKSKSKQTPFERFVAAVHLKNTKQKAKGGGSGQSKGKEKEKDRGRDVEFPPAHWELSDGNHSEVPDLAQDSDGGIPIPDIPPEPPLDTSNVTDEGEDTLESAAEAAPEPLSLAQRIQQMLSVLPLPVLPSSLLPQIPIFSSTPTPNTHDTHDTHDILNHGEAPDTPGSTSEASVDTAKPLPPVPAYSDPALVSVLSSPQIMNGSLDKGRPSVWSILDRLGVKSKNNAPGVNASGTPTRLEEEQEMNDQSSVMLYAPLVPDDRSEVEVAESEILSPEHEREDIHNTEKPPRSVLSGIWPFKGSGAGEDVTEGQGESGTSTPSSAGGRVNFEHPKASERRVWVPSATKLSLQICWWGYRLYLPPPVLDVLNNKRLETAKRAALLTTALKWFFDHIPMGALPPQARPFVQILKGLVPYAGYVGGFVAWSWGAIKGFDKGNGVVLTATWLLPVALVPGTWEDDEFPEVVANVRAEAGERI